MSCKKILIVGDNTISKEEAFQICSCIEKTTTIIAANVNEGLQKIKTEQPEVIICNLKPKPDQAAINFLSALRDEKKVPVIFIADQKNDDPSTEALTSNPDAILVKPFTTIQLVVSIKRVLHHYREINNLKTNKVSDKPNRTNGSMTKPSVRELDVIRQLAKGGTSQFIAEHLCISCATVQSHRKNLLNKYQARSSAELINIACRNNWLEIAG